MPTVHAQLVCVCMCVCVCVCMCVCAEALTKPKYVPSYIVHVYVLYILVRLVKCVTINSTDLIRVFL